MQWVERCFYGTALRSECTKGASSGRAGQFGFQKEMNALRSLRTGNAAETEAVTSLLGSTHEIESRIQEVYRWYRLWKADVRVGWGMLGRFQVRVSSAVTALTANYDWE